MAIDPGVDTSKLVGFVVELPDTGVDATKLVGYSVEAPPEGVSATKLTAYVVEGIPAGVATSKLVAYVVVADVNSNPPVWPSITLPDGYIGIPYSQSWDLFPPAATPISYSIPVGSLPPGLALSAVGVSGETITGTPTTLGTYPFTIRATNAYGFADQAMSITILTTPPVGGGSGSFVFIH